MKKILLIFSFISSIGYAQLEEFLPRAYGEPIILNNKMVFSYFTPEFGSELWVTDGTASGTQMLADIITGPNSSNPILSKTYVIDDVLYFRGANTPNSVWRTDGTPQGTFQLVNNNQIFDATGFVKCNGFILFASKIGGNDTLWRLWRMTTFPNSELPIINTFDGKVINNITLNSVVKLNESTVMFGANTNQDGWAIFGTTGATTEMIIDLYQGNNSTYNNYRQINSPRNIDGKIYFSGFQEATGFELWTSLGSASSTNLLKDINPNNTIVNAGGSPSAFTKVGNTIYFTANDGINGREVWKTEGTAASTQMVKDVTPGNASSLPQSLIEFNGFLYFSQSDGTNGTHVWKTDGTELGTVMVSDALTTSISSAFFDKTSDKLFFAGFSPIYGNELFMIDENDQLTMIADINPGINGSDPGRVIEYNGYIYFIAKFGNNVNTYRTYRIATSNLNVESQNQSIANIKIYPNPASDYFEITSTDDQTVEIEFVDIMGKKHPVNELSKNKFDISHLSNGIYIVKLKNYNNQQISNLKIVKK
ncbi:MAG: T9SS type A sorting domain-containing protein [Flavobacterium sp.]|nr:T9SS type A sorting domain-containing protein [Flavobacterium sp.]